MNYLEQPLKKVLTKIELNQGYLNHIAHDLEQFKNRLENELRPDNSFLKATMLVFSDLTGETDNGYENNFPSITSGYVVTTDNYIEKNNEIFNIVSLNLTVQNYEATETYIKNILTEYFRNNDHIAKEVIGKINFRRNRDQVNWRLTVQKLHKGKNNKGYLDILRLLSKEFNEGEQNNIRNVNLENWFEMISIARHSIVHSNSIIKNEQKNKLSNTADNYLRHFFNVNEIENGSKQLSLDITKQRRLFTFFAEYCFFIFKSLSQSSGLEWRILKEMNNEA